MKHPVQKNIASWWHPLRDVWAADAWSADTAQHPWWQSQILQIRRIMSLIVNGFREDNCPLHAAALTYNTLLALIPTMAVGLWILRGVGAADLAKERILESIQIMPMEFQGFITDALGYVDNTNFATLGGIGLLILVWMAVTVLSRVESSFNKVWAVQVNRNYLRKTADYISILVVVPILIIAATTINTAMSSEVLTAFFQERLGIPDLMYRRVLSVTPWVGAWMALTFMNIYIPNTRVRLLPGLCSGLVGGSLWILWQLLYLRFQFGIANYNAIYGTFASVPVFLAWVYVSWQIVLLSAEVAFGIQHRNTPRRDTEVAAADLRSRYLLMLAILARAADALLHHHGPLDGTAFAEAQQIPVRLVNGTVTHLIRAGYLAEVAKPLGAVVLLRSPETVQLRDVMATAMRDDPESAAATDSLPPHFQAAWQQLEQALTRTVGKATLRDFVDGIANDPTPRATGGPKASGNRQAAHHG